MSRRLAAALLTLILLTPALQAQHTEALLEAIQADDPAEVRALLAAGADANARLEHVEEIVTPLGAAFDRGGDAMLDIIDLLLEAGADPNAVYGEARDRRAPILDALWAENNFYWEEREGQGDLMRRLLDAGAEPTLMYCGAFGPGSVGHQAMVMGLEHILEMLAEAGANDVVLEPELRALFPHEILLQRHDAPLHAALFAGDVQAVERLLTDGHDARRVLEGRTLLNGEVERFAPLGIALYFSQSGWPPVEAEAATAMARLLVNAGADPDEMIEPVCEGIRVPALIAAIGTGDTDLVRAFLEAGADPEMTLEGRATRVPPLVIAAQEGHAGIVRLLLGAGADPDAAATAGPESISAWQAARDRGRDDVVELLRAAGADEPAPGPDRHAAYDAYDAPGSYNDPFTDAFAICEPGAMMNEALPDFGVAIEYEILGSEGGRCRVSMTYTDNPNPAWVDQPLTMLLDPAAPLLEQVMDAVDACLAGNTAPHDCHGPLLDQLNR